MMLRKLWVLYPLHLKILDFCYCFLRLRNFKKLAMGLAITRFLKFRRRKNQVAKKPVFSGGVGIFILACLIGCQTSGSKSHTTTKKSSTQTVWQRQHPNAYQNSDKDSAPSGPVPTRFKAVKPTAEPLSRYGNPATYHVAGQRYDVLTTASGYRQRGLASWYGTKFHSRRTSSGEHYDMYALTAAHRTLPLPTYVRVKNLKNGREAIVKINDRGPFHSGRIIDLSYGAAAKLGIFPQGTAPVEIEALTLKNHQAQYYLQAGAFDSNRLAEQLKTKLTKLSKSPVSIHKDQRRYLVRVGPFANRRMTEDLKRKLAHQGVSGAFSMMM